MQDGLGMEVWPDGSRYFGQFFLSAKHGHGKFTSANGGYYEGNFDQNCFDGHGKCLFVTL